jgi:hypothetical protein
MWHALERGEMGTIFMGKREERRPHGRSRHKCEDKIGLTEICGTVSSG